MSIQKPFLVLAMIGTMCVGLAATAKAENVALNKTYAYFLQAPGQGAGHYFDDWTVHGEHAVKTAGLGVYDQGLLADGEIAAAASGGLVTPLLGIRGGGNAPPVEIIFDLDGQFTISDFVIGTVVSTGANNNPPDDVTISYSTTGTDAGDFGSAQFYDLKGMFGPLANGHHDMPLVGSGTSARYVKFAFDGGSMAEPGGSDPNEKYMFDEITINGTLVPEPSTFLLAALGLLGLLGWGRRRRK